MDSSEFNWTIIRKHDLAGRIRVDVAPICDLVEHDIIREDGVLCWCHPEIELDDGERVVIHNAMDGRK